jgi:hypothetical protein
MVAGGQSYVERRPIAPLAQIVSSASFAPVLQARRSA